MVFGLFEGEIEIKTDKTSYKPGEVIKGEVTLKLNQPKKAKELRVLFYGVCGRRMKYYRVDKSGSVHRSIDRIWEQSLSLDGEKEYSKGVSNYSFEVSLPQYTSPQVSNISLGPLKFDIGSPDPVKAAKWYLEASLNVSMEFDINKKIQITILV